MTVQGLILYMSPTTITILGKPFVSTSCHFLLPSQSDFGALLSFCMVQENKVVLGKMKKAKYRRLKE